jgi:neopullulanase
MSVDTPAWVRDAVFYQIFPDRFARSGRVPMPGPLEAWDAPPTIHGFKGGDLYGIAERLPELHQLGVTALYMTPVFASASNHRYHTYDYLAVDPLLGGDAALRELIDAAHARGMRVVLDGVFNHCGRGFWPFHHVAENGAESPYRDWFHLDPEVLAGRQAIDPYPEERPAPDHVGQAFRGGYRGWWGLPALPKLNVSNPMLREYLMGVGEHWLRFGIDGWRLDVPSQIEDPTFWPEFRRRCRAVKPDAYLVGEIWHEAPDWLAGDRFDALMNYPLAVAILGFAGNASLDRAVIDVHHTLRTMLERLDGRQLASRLEQLTTNYPSDVIAVQLNLLDSHDTPRALTLLGGDVAALRLAFVLQLTLPGAPCIYYGDEIAMQGRDDPDSRRAFPAEPGAGDQDLRSFVAALAAARHEHVALRRGEVRTIGADGDGIALERSAEGRRAMVALNAGRSTQELALDGLEDADGKWRPLAGLVSPGVELIAEGSVVRLPPQASAVFLRA